MSLSEAYTPTDDKKVSFDADSLKVSVEEELPEFTQDEWIRVRKRMDLRIMPWVCLTYLVMRIDVNNITNAAIMNREKNHGIMTDLSLTAQQWSWVVACFFYPYAAFEPLSTLLMHKFTPSRWIGRIMITWGIVACTISAAQNYGGLITTRVLLGIMESGYYPCIIYYLAFFFRPEELALRVAMFYSFGQVSGFVGGFLAFAVSFLDSDKMHGWRWLFIIEGIPAILMGIATFYILPDFPETAKFLSPRERLIIASRLSEHAPKKNEHTWSTKQAKELFTSPTFYSFAFVWAFHAVGGFGLSLVLPTVIFQLGFQTSAMSNVLSMPPSLLTFFLLNGLGWLVQTGRANPFLIGIFLETTNIICCIILLTVKVNIVKYLALMVATGTAGSVYPILWPARVKASKGTTNAGLAIGITNALAQLSGILGPQLFLSSYGPTYRLSFIVCCGLLFGAIVSIGGCWWLMRDDFKIDAKLRSQEKKNQQLAEGATA